ncbi:ABC transporter substrate-binding protein [Candidatus Aquiluna sp. UB-MaderosW2red]|uniref:ABC transporter substrate-binding protein n=1 Tax=Candidatus Aquiluna sp. UB-MaderosW2red TaxID=1855377 RepID=UPI000875CEB7|nr:ABC transporter substrate-binding protein [Candidatus Aquiluna sp. UB-MaderosW2red]SCX03959.1 raffinose/stachyose/melibiose transport system substrate-binding protein [Candidatus Aquiluna sp. UB-MaderosW2red]
MKMKMRRIATVAAVTMTSAILLAGCSAANPNTGSDDAEVVWNEPTASLEGVTLDFWTATTAASLADQVIDAFEKATGAKINVIIVPDIYETNAPTRIATGAIPDLAMWQPTASMLALLKPESGLQNFDEAPWIDSLTPAVQELGKVDGTRYAAFVSSPSVIGMYYNKKVFAEAGIDELPDSFEELMKDADAIKALGIAPFFGAVGDQWPTQWWPQVLLAEEVQDGLWDRVNANEEGFDDETIQAAIQQYKDMLDDGYFNDDNLTSTFSESGPALLSGEAAMVLQVNPFISLLQASADTATIDKNIGWFPISRDGNVGISIPGVENAVVAPKTGDAKKEAAARQFIRFWLETGYAAYIEDAGAISIQPNVESPTGVPAIAQLAADALTNSAGSMQQEAVANPDLYVFLANMAQGEMTPLEVGKSTQSQFAQVAAALGIDGF